MKKLTLLLMLGLMLTISGCEKEYAPVDPHRAILGKWEITHNTFGPVANPGGYDEYLPDSIVRFYDYKDEIFYYEKYWFADSLLIWGFVYIDPYDKDTIMVTSRFRFRFITHNKLQLELQEPALNPFSVYKRIK